MTELIINCIIIVLDYYFVAPTSSPRNISGQALSSTSVILYWHPPPVEHQNGLIREYRIDITEISSNSSFSVVSQNLSTIIGSLHPNYYYDFSVSAVTVLTGPPSVTIRLILLEDGKFVFLHLVLSFFHSTQWFTR